MRECESCFPKRLMLIVFLFVVVLFFSAYSLMPEIIFAAEQKNSEKQMGKQYETRRRLNINLCIDISGSVDPFNILYNTKLALSCLEHEDLLSIIVFAKKPVMILSDAKIDTNFVDSKTRKIKKIIKIDSKKNLTVDEINNELSEFFDIFSKNYKDQRKKENWNEQSIKHLNTGKLISVDILYTDFEKLFSELKQKVVVVDTILTDYTKKYNELNFVISDLIHESNRWENTKSEIDTLKTLLDASGMIRLIEEGEIWWYNNPIHFLEAFPIEGYKIKKSKVKDDFVREICKLFEENYNGSSYIKAGSISERKIMLIYELARRPNYIKISDSPTEKWRIVAPGKDVKIELKVKSTYFRERKIICSVTRSNGKPVIIDTLSIAMGDSKLCLNPFNFGYLQGVSESSPLQSRLLMKFEPSMEDYLYSDIEFEYSKIWEKNILDINLLLPGKHLLTCDLIKFDRKLWLIPGDSCNVELGFFNLCKSEIPKISPVLRNRKEYSRIKILPEFLSISSKKERYSKNIIVIFKNNALTSPGLKNKEIPLELGFDNLTGESDFDIYSIDGDNILRLAIITPSIFEAAFCLLPNKLLKKHNDIIMTILISFSFISTIFFVIFNCKERKSGDPEDESKKEESILNRIFRLDKKNKRKTNLWTFIGAIMLLFWSSYNFLINNVDSTHYYLRGIILGCSIFILFTTFLMYIEKSKPNYAFIVSFITLLFQIIG